MFFSFVFNNYLSRINVYLSIYGITAATWAVVGVSCWISVILLS